VTGLLCSPLFRREMQHVLLLRAPGGFERRLSANTVEAELAGTRLMRHEVAVVWTVLRWHASWTPVENLPSRARSLHGANVHLPLLARLVNFRLTRAASGTPECKLNIRPPSVPWYDRGQHATLRFFRQFSGSAHPARRTNVVCSLEVMSAVCCLATALRFLARGQLLDVSAPPASIVLPKTAGWIATRRLTLQSQCSLATCRTARALVGLARLNGRHRPFGLHRCRARALMPMLCTSNACSHASLGRWWRSGPRLSLQCWLKDSVGLMRAADCSRESAACQYPATTMCFGGQLIQAHSTTYVDATSPSLN